MQRTLEKIGAVRVTMFLTSSSLLLFYMCSEGQHAPDFMQAAQSSDTKPTCPHGIDPELLPAGLLTKTRRPQGKEFCMYLHDDHTDSWLSKEILSLGHVEPEVSMFLDENIQKIAAAGDTNIHLLDVGGNIGWITLFSLASHPNVVVTVVEPLPWHRDLLTSSVKLNGWQDRVRIVGAALTNEDQIANTKSLCMTMNPTNAASTMVKNGLNDEQCQAEAGFKVPMTTIDRVLVNNSFGDVDIMKLDVEGYEGWALDGAQKLLQKPPLAVVSEWIGYRIHDSMWPHDPTEFFDRFFPPAQWSYSVAGRQEHGYVAVKILTSCWADPACNFHHGGDIFFRRT